ncbi:PP2C family protein-serine/threonine phosphatase [Methanococcus aeolicus]|uniref:PP2C family protein-serine/threonine phosphatase n=1 Tax=Methanococcus aeolicus TaxID=42879 RepID=UPI0021C9246B|nr:protein phosphatase 2C domain-containing protein [Methanococcus aeolicus]UXM84173.1 protein phosphatase 2C domain-containing protein [Methanococcus aeolicus]
MYLKKIIKKGLKKIGLGKDKNEDIKEETYKIPTNPNIDDNNNEVDNSDYTIDYENKNIKEDKKNDEIKIPEEKTIDIEIPTIEVPKINTEPINRNNIILEEENAYGVSHKGNRLNNEDYITIEKIKDIYLLAVADGVGGHNAGEVASEMAINTLKEIITEKYNENLSVDDISELLKEAYNKAHNEILKNSIDDKQGMGTTLTTAIIKGNKCIIANCGDSRTYIIRNGEIIFKTKDHSFVQALIDEGRISEEKAMTHPMKNIITSALGLDELKIDVYEQDLIDDDVLLMSSDGLHDYVSSADILKTVENIQKSKIFEFSNENNDNPKNIVDELLNKALEKTRDNVSIIAYKTQ